MSPLSDGHSASLREILAALNRMDIADFVVSGMKLCRVADSTNTVHHQTLQLLLDDISLQLLRELLILQVHLLLRVFLRVL